MSLRSILDRSRDALYSLASKAAPALVQVQTEEVGMSTLDLGHLPGLGSNSGILGGARTILFWISVLALLLLLGKFC